MAVAHHLVTTPRPNWAWSACCSGRKALTSPEQATCPVLVAHGKTVMA